MQWISMPRTAALGPCCRSVGRQIWLQCRDTGRSVAVGQRARSATSGRSRSPRKFPVSGRSRQHAEVAVAVDARRRHQDGDIGNVPSVELELPYHRQQSESVLAA